MFVLVTLFKINYSNDTFATTLLIPIGCSFIGGGGEDLLNEELLLLLFEQAVFVDIFLAFEFVGLLFNLVGSLC